MQIQNLSKADYYKSRNIVVPKIQHPIQPQAPIKSHFIPSLPSISIQVQQYHEAILRKEKQFMNNLNFQPEAHQKGVEIQDLRKQLANRMDQITQLKSQREKDQRRIELFQRQVFDLKSQLLKLQHEYDNKISYLTVASDNQRQSDLQRITYLEKQIEKAKEFFAFQLKSTKQLYETQIRLIQDTKVTINTSEEEFVKTLNIRMQRYASENQKLKNQLILQERQIDKRTIELEKQNFQLKAQLQSAQIKYQHSLKKNESDIEEKNMDIKYLNEQVKELKISFDLEKKRINDEKEYLEKVCSQTKKQLTENCISLSQQKSKTEQLKIKHQIHTKQLKELLLQTEKKFNEINTKILTSESQKQQIQRKYQLKIEEITNSQRNLNEEETLTFKKNYQDKVAFLQKQLEDKNAQIATKTIKIQTFDGQIYEKTQIIRSLQEKEKTLKKQILQVKQKNEKLSKEAKRTKSELETLKKENQREKREVAGRAHQEQVTVLQKKVQDSDEIINKLTKELKTAKTQAEQDLRVMKEQLMKKEEQFMKQVYEWKQSKEDLKIEIVGYKKKLEECREESINLRKDLDLSKKAEAFHQLEVEQAKATVEEIKKNQNMLLKENDECKAQVERINKVMEERMKILLEAYAQMKKKTIQFVTKQKNLKNEIQQLKHSHEEQLKRIMNKHQSLKSKYDEMTKNHQKLHIDLENLQQENIRLQQIKSQKEISQNNIVQQQKKATDKITEDLKDKLKSLQAKLQKTTHQYEECRTRNIQMFTQKQKLVNECYQLSRKVELKQIEISHFEDQAKSARAQSQKQDQQIQDLTSKLIASQSLKIRHERQNQILIKRINEWIKRMTDLEQINEQEVDSIESIETKLKTVAIKVEKLNSENRSDKMHKEAVEKNFEKYRIEAEQEIKQLKEQLLNQQETIGKMELMINNIIKESEKQEKRLIQQIDHIRNEKQRKDKKIASLQKKIESKENELKISYKKIYDLETKVQSSQQAKIIQFRDKDNQIFQLQEKIKSNEEQLEQRYSEIQLLQTQIKNITDRCEANDKDLKRFKDERRIQIQELQKNLNQITAKNDQLIKRQKQTTKIHQSQILVLNNTLDNFKQVNASYIRKIQDLQQEHNNQMEDKENENARNIAALLLNHQKAIAHMNIQLRIHKDQVEKLKRQYEIDTKRLNHNLQKQKKNSDVASLKFKLQITNKDQEILKRDQQMAAMNFRIEKLKFFRNKCFSVKQQFQDHEFNQGQYRQWHQQTMAERSMSKSQLPDNSQSSVFLSRQNFPQQKLSQSINDKLSEQIETTQKKEAKHQTETKTVKVTKLTKGTKQVYEVEAQEIQVEETQYVEIQEFVTYEAIRTERQTVEEYQTQQEEENLNQENKREEDSSNHESRREEDSSNYESRREEDSSNYESRREEESSNHESRRDEESSNHESRRDEESSNHESRRDEKPSIE